MKLLALVVALVMVAGSVGAAHADEPTIKVLNLGKQGTRKELRFKPAKGAKRSIVLTTSGTRARGGKGKVGKAEATPGTKLTVDLEVTDVAASGDITSRITYRELETTKPKGVSAEEAAQQDGVLSQFKGVSVVAVTTSRGILKTSKVDESTASAQAKAALEFVNGLSGQLSQPLPEEPVGVGAKWQQSTSATVGGLDATTTVVYQLTKLTDTRATIKLTMTVDGKGTGQGSLTTKTTGKGEIVLDFGYLAPASSKLDMKTTVNLVDGDMSLTQVQTQKTTIKIE